MKDCANTELDMINNTTEKTVSDKRTIVKVSAMWHFVADYLEMLNFTGAIYDEFFSCSLRQLLKYVYGKIEVPQAKDILCEYVVYELEQ